MRKELRKIIEDLQVWLPSETEEFQLLVAGALAALPGGERLEEAGVEPLPIGWKEAELLGRLLVAVKSADDVRQVVESLYVEPS